mmetsp:Transcript_3186/g.6478  ORF Transcript_3186/g.6478 Transcript_3186/m.6478 type:complete len:213 (-) Transcript_3186:233-871(-)
MTLHPSAPGGSLGIPFSSTSNPDPSSLTMSAGGWPHSCISCISRTISSMSSGCFSYASQIFRITPSCRVYLSSSSGARVARFSSSHAGYLFAISVKGSCKNSLERICCIMLSITPCMEGSLSRPCSCSVNFFITSSSERFPCAPPPAACPDLRISTVSFTALERASSSSSPPANPTAEVHFPSSHALFSSSSCFRDKAWNSFKYSSSNFTSD